MKFVECSHPTWGIFIRVLYPGGGCLPLKKKKIRFRGSEPAYFLVTARVRPEAV